jgi:outer membrane lipoprotein-sorting protein
MRIVLLALVLMGGNTAVAEPPTAQELVRQAMDHWRGTTSHSVITMTIHRPDWERSMTLEGWSEGDKLSLVRVIEPPRDAGNATLLNDNNMWTYTPKINRIVKVPSSMMAQSWMGSDFSNKDIAKSTDIIDEYDHELSATEQRDGHTVYTVTSIPHEDAAVVWGKEVLLIRDDFVLLEQQYWDQDGVLVKRLETSDVAEMGGRAVARVMRMGEIEKPDEWTRITTDEVQFDIELPAQMFTLSNLRNPRQ